jgi:hypothetical protein
MEQQEAPVMAFGKYKGEDVRDVPLSYLRWWKSALIESLRICGNEIRRREEMGVTEAEELQFSALPSFVRENLLERLEAGDEDQRAEIHRMIKIKFHEYSPKPRAPEFGVQHPDDEGEEVLDEDDAH